MSEKTNIAALDYLNSYDPAVGEAMTAELKRQRRNLELIASENIVSPAVMAAMGSLLTNKYAEGYPGKRYYGGCQCVDVVESAGRRCRSAICSSARTTARRSELSCARICGCLCRPEPSLRSAARI